MPWGPALIFVIGSGPAGVACAKGLLDAGAEVTMLDSGQTIEPQRLQKILEVAQRAPAEWTGESVAFMKDGMSAGASGIPLKLAYGSDFPYRLLPGATPVRCEGSESRPSYAQGGLSTVWGSAVLPYLQRDLEDWPITQQDLEPGYRAVFRWMPLAARRDDLEADFPLYSDRYTPLPMSRQAQGLLADLERRRDKLKAEGISFGVARLAVKAQLNGTSGCVACGLCMYGCPHRLIYSVDSTLSDLLKHPHFHYRPGTTVRTVEENATGVAIQGIEAQGGEIRMQGDRVFVGAGVLGTAAVLLRSLGWYDSAVKLRDSQYFLLPLLRVKGTSDVATERLHTLAQLFIEVLDRGISPYTIHLQTYTYNELFREPVVDKLGPLKRFFPFETFVGRLLLFQGYLHSAHSPDMDLTLRKQNGTDFLHLRGMPKPETQKILRKVTKKLSGLMGTTGLVPLVPMFKAGRPGRGFHSGGTFPMSNTPTRGQSDIFGRPAGLSRIHAVDSTIFPSIPATTITLSVMANAYRIGSMLNAYS